MRTLLSLAAGLLVAISCSASMAWADEPPKADNSAHNKGSMREDAVTAEKQGNAKSDIEVLAKVRKSIVAAKGLSMNAKNVKILSNGGSVTLKGPVDSEAEKSRVEELAKSCRGVTGVTSMITVAEQATNRNPN